MLTVNLKLKKHSIFVTDFENEIVKEVSSVILKSTDKFDKKTAIENYCNENNVDTKNVIYKCETIKKIYTMPINEFIKNATEVTE